MKKILTLCVLALTIATTAKAQFEIGGVVGGLNGASCKYWLSDKLALQADLAVGLTQAAGGIYYKGNHGPDFNQGFYDFTLNPNVAYHFDLPENFQLYAGGGLNLGLVSYIENTDPQGISGKFGINALAGVAYNFADYPIVLAFDFRPGYGLGFTKSDAAHLSFFDWKIAVAVRYKL